jgi:tRNA-(ms[2]io[6]A)-hydroxylase
LTDTFSLTDTIPLVPSSDRWVARAVSDVRTLLVDHAHCEKKAAATAIGIVFRAPERTELCLAMSKLAREELLHFERLLAVLDEREIPFERQMPSGYAGKLVDRVRGERQGGARPALPQLADELLVASIIEARSTERFRRLAGVKRDDDVNLGSAVKLDIELCNLFAELAEVEARHGSVYVEQACGFSRKPAVERRLAELCAFEASILETPREELRLHAG